MEMKQVAIGNPVTVAGVTLIPVTEMSLSHWQHNGCLSLLGTKHPLGIIVLSQAVERAFRITGEEVSVDQFVHEVPEVKGALEKMHLSLLSTSSSQEDG